MIRDSMEDRRKFSSDAIAFMAIALLYLLFHLAGIGCPFRFLTGICCPGCGMTRAVISLLSFRLSDAVYYHPLVLILPLVALVFLMRRRIPQNVFHILTAIILALFVIVFLVRIFDPDNDVVTFQLHQGFVVQTIKSII